MRMGRGGLFDRAQKRPAIRAKNRAAFFFGPPAECENCLSHRGFLQAEASAHVEKQGEAGPRPSVDGRNSRKGDRQAHWGQSSI